MDISNIWIVLEGKFIVWKSIFGWMLPQSWPWILKGNHLLINLTILFVLSVTFAALCCKADILASLQEKNKWFIKNNYFHILWPVWLWFNFCPFCLAVNKRSCLSRYMTNFTPPTHIAKRGKNCVNSSLIGMSVISNAFVVQDWPTIASCNDSLKDYRTLTDWWRKIKISKTHQNFAHN